eukprot:537777-Rhodomonas_salina.1
MPFLQRLLTDTSMSVPDIASHTHSAPRSTAVRHGCQYRTPRSTAVGQYLGLHGTALGHEDHRVLWYHHTQESVQKPRR